MKNYSRQREEILRVLRQLKTHPDAKEIYYEVKKTIPNISLGTVYRNLAELTKEGYAVSIDGDGTCARFDGDTSVHAHLCCEKCGKITDICVTDDFLLTVATQNGFSVTNRSYAVHGICKNCLSNNK